MAIGSAASDHRLKIGGTRRLSWAVAGAFLAIAPVFALIVASIAGSDGGESVRIARTRLPDYMLASVALVTLVAAGAGLIGGGLAWLVAMFRFPGRNLFDWALMLPLAAPAYVLAYAYLDLTTASGPLQIALRSMTGWQASDYWFPEISGLYGAAFIFSIGLYPYVYALARRAFEDQAGRLLEASRTLGRGPWSAFAAVALPLARPALIAGIALASMETLADYGAVAHLGVPTFTFGILRAWSASGEPIAAARLAVMLLIICLALLAIERRARGRARVTPPRGNAPNLPRQLKGFPAWAAFSLCGLVISLGLVIPATYLAIIAVEAGTMPRGALSAGARSIILAAATALLTSLMAYGLASKARLGSPMAAYMRELCASGYAVPGAAAALGVLLLAGLTRWLLAPFWVIPIAGIPLLLLAYQTRFAAAAIGPVGSAFERISVSLDAAARSLGCDASALTRRVHLPILTPSILTAGLLVFVEVVKELPATMILRPFNFDTLAVMAHAYAADERLAQAAAPALLIVLICAPVMALANFMGNAARRRTP